MYNLIKHSIILLLLISLLCLFTTSLFAQSNEGGIGTTGGIGVMLSTGDKVNYIVGQSSPVGDFQSNDYKGYSGLYGIPKWRALNSPTTSTLSKVYFVNSSTGYAIGDSLGYGVILKTTNGGFNWVRQNSGVSNLLRNIFFVNSDTGYVVGDGGIIRKTTNGGSDWGTVISGTSNSLYSVFFLSPNTGYVVGTLGTIRKTTDAGTNWNSQISGINTQLNSIFFVNSYIGYVVGNYGIILKTTDGGTKWNSQTSGINAHIYSIFFADANTGYAVGDNGIILNTTNGGTNWNKQTIGNYQFNDVFLLDANNGYITSNSGKIYKKINGSNWYEFDPSGVNSSLNSIYFTSTNVGYAIGNQGKILKYMNNQTLPNAPINFKLTDLGLGNRSVMLTWNDVDNETGYIIYRFNEPIATLPANTTNYIDIPTTDEYYSYKIRAVNNNGVSEFSKNAQLSIDITKTYSKSNLSK